MTNIKLMFEYGFKEYLHQIVWTRGRCPGGRGLVFFTLVLFFLETAVLLTVGASSELLAKFGDIFLGSSPGFGMPLIVRPDITIGAAPISLSEKVIRQIRQRVPFFPYREVVLDQPGYIFELPGDNTWRRLANVAIDSNSREHFIGRAISVDSPMWSLTGNDPAPLRIRISRKMTRSGEFQKRFDVSAYFAALKDVIPADIIDETVMPLVRSCSIADATSQQATTLHEGGCDFSVLRVLWLRSFTLGRDGRASTEYLPFSIDWVDAFPGASQTAFLVPLETYSLWETLQHVGGYHHFPEATAFVGLLAAKSRSARERLGNVYTGPDTRIAAFSMSINDADLSRITKGIEGAVVDKDRRSNRFVVSLPAPMAPWKLVDLSDRLNFSIGPGLDEVAADEIGVKEFAIVFPCSDRRPPPPNTKCLDGKAHYRFATDAMGYSSAIAYFSDISNISSIRRFIKDNKLTLSEAYEDAIVKFAFMKSAVDKLAHPIIVSFLLLFLIITFVLVSSLVSERRSRYALMLGRGLSAGDVAVMVIFQLFLCVTVSTPLSILASNGALMVGGDYISHSALKYEQTTITGAATFTLGWGIGIWVGCAVIAGLIGVVTLRANGITRKNVVAELVSG